MSTKRTFRRARWRRLTCPLFDAGIVKVATTRSKAVRQFFDTGLKCIVANGTVTLNGLSSWLEKFLEERGLAE
jgi:hypothetical protein